MDPQTMLKISILKVDNPSCLWGRVIGGSGGDAETTEQYDSLMTQMNLFYHDVTQDLRKLKPMAIEEGQVCVVYWSLMKSWCRAVVESVIMDSVSRAARCVLVDHGERIIVPSDQIRVPVGTFLQLPFWVRRFHLGGIKPTTLRVSVYEESPELTQSTQWDSSATLYLHNLLQASTWTEAMVLGSESESTSIELYLTIRDIKICVNDDLVAKKFAYYNRESDEISWLDEVDRLPVMLSKSIFTQTVSPSVTSQKPAAQAERAPVMSQGGACDWLTAPSVLESQHHELATGEGPHGSGATGKVSPGSQSEKSCESDDTDSSLAAALTRNHSLFKCLKFLNPGSSDHQLPPTLENCEQEVCAAAAAAASSKSLSGLLSPLHNGEPAAPVEDERPMSSSSSSADSEAAEVEKTWRSEEDAICSRLLEWLNPEPLNPDPDAVDDTLTVPRDPRRSGVLVHSALPLEPCSGLDDAPVTDALRWVLRKKQYSALSPADCYSWPAVARGFNAVVVSPGADEPLGYLAPLLTHILLNSVFSCLTSSSGPVAVLLCPGWERVQVVFDLLDDSRLRHIVHPTAGLLGTGADEAETFRIPKNCLVLVTTPFSLARLLSCRCFMFLRLSHLVLDQADQLFSLAPDQMATILQHFRKVTSNEERACCPQQLVAVAKRWTSHMEGLLTGHMPYPCIVMAVPEEAALYGDVQQIILMTQESSKTSELLNTLDLNPAVGQKTLIITSSAEEVEDVCKAVHSKSALCLQAHEKSTHQFDFVVQQWSKNVGAGTHVILVTTNECLRCFGIRDATCVVHYDFPTSPKVFGTRLFCMADNFRNLSQRVSSQDQSSSCPRVARSVLLISERNARHVVGVLRYLGRTDAVLMPELLSFARGVHAAREDLKTGRPLCSYLKSFGVCRDSSSCPDRHRFLSRLDQSELPAAGVIEVVPLYIKTASLFYGRIIRKDDGGFDVLASEMASYYADKKPGAAEILEGGMYAVQEDDVFHRVKILSAPVRPDALFFRVLVRFVDVGKEEEVKSHQILQLPERFHALPGQAVEIVVCRVKPVDKEVDWHPKVTRAVSQKIRGVQHRARAVLSLGNTVFVDPMVRVTQMPGMKTIINEHNVQSEIIRTGMGMSNPEHVDLLRALCRQEEEEQVEERVEEQVEEEVEEEQVEEGLEEQVEEGLEEQVEERLEEQVEERPEEQVEEQVEERPEVCSDQEGSNTSGQSRDGGGVRQVDVVAARPHCCQNGLPAGDGHSSNEQINTNGTDSDSTKSFHPQVRWHQTSDAVTVTVKLTSPESQRCDVLQDRVVYRGRVDGRSYRAELELRADVVVDRCCWEMKSNEPVIKLVKRQQGHWDKLTRTKNIFVSYDMEHIEEDEDAAPQGQWFVENTGEENCYVNSESDSDSD